jgi:glucokinase
VPVLGLDLGGTKLLACVVDDRGSVALRRRVPTGRSFGPDEALAAIAQLVNDVRDARGTLGRLDAIGLGFPGLVDHARGVVRSSIMLDGWCDVPLAARVEELTGVPCAIDNDANAAALCELDRRRVRDMLFVAVGTGIGGALVLGGRLWRGAGGFAGELGHVAIDRGGPPCACGRRGCVHLYASGAAIEAGATVDDAADALGAAIGSALDLLDVPLVVLGGGVAELGPTYVARVARAARRECFREIGDACAFEPACAGYEAAALGAAMLARELAPPPARPAEERHA